MRRFIAIALLLLFVGCNACVVMQPPRSYAYGAQPLAHEEWYRTLHRKMTHCLDKSGFKIVERDFDDIEWLQTAPVAMGPVAGQWHTRHRIYIDTRYVHSMEIISHELGHWMTQLGDTLHGELAFHFCIGAAQQ